MSVEMLTGWAIKCLVGAKEKPTEYTCIMVSEELPSHNDIDETVQAGCKQPLFEVLSVQRSVPLAVVQDAPEPEQP